MDEPLHPSPTPPRSALPNEPSSTRDIRGRSGAAQESIWSATIYPLAAADAENALAEFAIEPEPVVVVSSQAHEAASLESDPLNLFAAEVSSETRRRSTHVEQVRWSNLRMAAAAAGAATVLIATATVSHRTLRLQRDSNQPSRPVAALAAPFEGTGPAVLESRTILQMEPLGPPASAVSAGKEGRSALQLDALLDTPIAKQLAEPSEMQIRARAEMNVTHPQAASAPGSQPLPTRISKTPVENASSSTTKPFIDAAPPSSDAEPAPSARAGTATVSGVATPFTDAIPPAPVPAAVPLPTRTGVDSTPPPAASVAPSAIAPIAINDTGAIQTALTRYRTAFGELDAQAAIAVWPTVDAKMLERAFDQLEQQQLEFDNCDIAVSGVRATASCSGKAGYVPKIGAKTQRTQARQWRFNLRKANDAWLIEKVDSR